MSFIGYTEGLSDARHERFFVPGARLAVADFPNGAIFSNKRTLIDDPHGMMRDAKRKTYALNATGKARFLRVGIAKTE
jgi:hypothetical protein